MAGLVLRPEPRNDVVKRLVQLQCRLIANEDDTTISRDLAYAEETARGCIPEDVVEAIKAVSSKCMLSCNLARYADRKNPCIFIINLATQPLAQSRQAWTEALEIKHSKLLDSVAAPDRKDLRVSFQITVLNLKNDEVRAKNSSSRRPFEAALRAALASAVGGGLGPEDVKVELWSDAIVDIRIVPTQSLGADDIKTKLDSLTTEELSRQVEDAFQQSQDKEELDKLRHHHRHHPDWNKVYVGEITQKASLVTDRTDAIFKVCSHSAWLEQNTRDWEQAQQGTMVAPGHGYRKSMEEDREIVERFSELMGFETW